MHYPSAKDVILLAGTAILLAGCGTYRSEAPPTTPIRQDASGAGSSSLRLETNSSVIDATRVVIDNFAYSPREIIVAPGSRVLWINRDDVPHTVTSTAKPRAFDSGALDGEESFTFVFPTPGTYDYFCALHPHMTGRVIIK
jgi:plastocyanin